MTTATIHRWAPLYQVMDYLHLGWIALPTFEGTHHQFDGVHVKWLCDCPAVTPVTKTAVPIEG